jgi:L-ascorbate metabolism protein UlaG (beta-lactamase superfamily)
MTYWLLTQASLHVAYDDRTEFGSPMSRRPEHIAREVFAPVVDHVRAAGFEGLTGKSVELLTRSVTGPRFGELAQLHADGSWELDERVRFVDTRLARPRMLTVGVEDGEGLARVTLPDGYWPWVHDTMAALCVEGLTEKSVRALHPDIRRLFNSLREEGLLANEPPPPAAGEIASAPVTFCGHNTIVVRGATGAVIVDPWLPARSTNYPPDYQPLQLSQLGPISAVLITHSHPDHLDPASLLRIPCDLPVVVPEIERETLLAADFRLRLEELGFRNIIVLQWGRSHQFGDVTVTALPFYGEQPTDALQLHPEIRNVGNTYRIATPECAVVALADSGRDSRGDAAQVGLQSRITNGPTDVVFSGYRGWATYPIQLLFSSVAQFIYFVPPSMWGCRMQLMTGTDEAIDVAERFGASTLVPYADGGAPWFWNMGLGPRLDEHRTEVVGFDPFPERVAEAASARTSLPGTMSEATARVVLMRPGESLTGVRRNAERVVVDGHRWPW